jgi:hypothetical protein
MSTHVVPAYEVDQGFECSFVESAWSLFHRTGVCFCSAETDMGIKQFGFAQTRTAVKGEGVWAT